MDAVASAVGSSDVGSWMMPMIALVLVDAGAAAAVGAATGALVGAAAAGFAVAAGAVVAAAGGGLGAAGGVVGAAPTVAGEVGATAVGVLHAASRVDSSGTPTPIARSNSRRVVRAVIWRVIRSGSIVAICYVPWAFWSWCWAGGIPRAWLS